MALADKYTNLAPDTFFSRPLAKWFSMILLLVCGLTLGMVWQSQPSVEEIIKVCLLTVPATTYLLYRSFIAQQ